MHDRRATGDELILTAGHRAPGARLWGLSVIQGVTGVEFHSTCSCEYCSRPAHASSEPSKLDIIMT
jgi:hypothetical protein